MGYGGVPRCIPAFVLRGARRLHSAAQQERTYCMQPSLVRVRFHGQRTRTYPPILHLSPRARTLSLPRYASYVSFSLLFVKYMHEFLTLTEQNKAS